MSDEKIWTSEEILAAEDLYDLQDSFGSLGIPFKYQLTDEEIEWALFIHGSYEISDWVLENMDDNGVITFGNGTEMSQALHDDGMAPKAVMLSDHTALQRLFLWLAEDIEE